MPPRWTWWPLSCGLSSPCASGPVLVSGLPRCPHEAVGPLGMASIQLRCRRSTANPPTPHTGETGQLCPTRALSGALGRHWHNDRLHRACMEGGFVSRSDKPTGEVLERRAAMERLVDL